MEQNKTLKVSIVIRAYNAEATVASAIQSALAQEYPREAYEIIVIDDGSTDGTAAAVDSFATSAQVRIIHQKNQGAILAANNAFQEARGEYVTLLDSDDEFAPGLLRTMVPILDSDPGTQFAYCDYSEEFEGARRQVVVEDVFQMIAGGTLWRRSEFEKEDWFSNEGIFDEYDLILRTWGRWRFAHVATPLYIYHRSRSSLTGTAERVRQGIERLRARYPERAAEIDRIRSYILPV